MIHNQKKNSRSKRTNDPDIVISRYEKFKTQFLIKEFTGKDRLGEEMANRRRDMKTLKRNQKVILKEKITIFEIKCSLDTV